MNTEYQNWKMEKEELEKRIKWYENKYGPYIEDRGLHNWKNLFRKPSLYEIVILSMVILSLFMYWAYSVDVNNSFQNGYNTCLNNFTYNPIIPDYSNITIERGFNYGG